MAQSSNWYKHLKKSPLTPPDWVFSVVWPLLYGSIVAYYVLMILNTVCSLFTCIPLILFTIQMVLNFFWPLVFFKLRNLKAAFGIILTMVGLTIATVYYSFGINPPYTYIIIPYLCWISFASYLNGYIVVHN